MHSELRIKRIGRRSRSFALSFENSRAQRAKLESDGALTVLQQQLPKVNEFPLNGDRTMDAEESAEPGGHGK